MEELDIRTIKKRSVQGIIALTSRTFFLQLISFAAFLIISSLLKAQDIGIYTAVTAMQRIISFFTDFGIGAALIQKKEALTQEDLNTSFTIQAGVTFLILILVFLFQNIIASLFSLPVEGIHLLLALVFTIFISSFKTIPSILLERDIQFGKLIIPQIAEALAFNIVLIILVLNQFGIASYTWAFIVSSLVGIPFYYAISPWKIGLGIDKKSLHHLKFGAQFQAKNILATIKDDMLTVILKFLSLSYAQIGYIGFAQRLSFFVYRYIVDSVTKVTFSTYSRIQDHTEHLKKAIEKSLFFVSMAMFPILTGLIILSPYVIEYFPNWNNKWEPALFSIIFFSLNAMISSLSGILINVLDATGRVKTTLKLMGLWTILTWILTPILITIYGYNGVSIASFLITLTIVITIYQVKKIVDFAFLQSIFKPATATIVMGIVVYLLAVTLISNFLFIFVVAALGAIVYGSVLYLIAKDELIHDIKTLRKV